MSAKALDTVVDQTFSVASHFHCYLLRSLDPRHPHKTYIGFTTDPKRRLRQHNGDLKSGGARRTKRSGRPWQFVGIVHGFTTQKLALQFEWAWQNCGKSLAVRHAVGDVEARKLSRKRGPKAALAILKTLLVECEHSLCQNNVLDVYFFEQEWRDEFLGIQTETGRPLPQATTCFVVCGVEEMPFWKERKQKNGKRAAKITSSVENEDDESSAPVDADTTNEQDVPASDCALCCRPIGNGKVTCIVCSKDFHDICLEVEMDDSDEEVDYSGTWACPRCRKNQSETFKEGTDQEMHVMTETLEKSSPANMQYRNVEASFESDDLSIGESVEYGGDMVDWDYDNVHWDDDSRSTPESPLVEQVTQGVLQQTLGDDTPAQDAEEEAMIIDSPYASRPRSSPELVDLTNTPGVAPPKPSNDDADVIDLSESP